MATIKGQHLRILLGGRCITAATSCQVHIAMTVEQRSTKDTEGDFAVNAPVGMNWDMQAEALVSKRFEQTTNMVKENPNPVGNLDIYYTDTFMLNAGDSITVTIPQGPPVSGLALVADDRLVLKSSAPPARTFTYTATKQVEVYVGSSIQTAVNIVITEANAAYTTEELMQLMVNKAPVGVQFALTEGSANREVNRSLLEGDALITDVNVNAANRQDSTATIQLTGTGELTFVEEEED